MPATPSLKLLNERIEALSKTPGFKSAQAVVGAIVRLLGVDDTDGWRLFHDSEGKLRANGHWFMRAEGYADRLATYEVAKGNDKNLDLKVYWVQKQDKSVIHWITALTPNFEDAPYLASENVGIDFIIPEKADRVLIVLSKEHALRVIELKDRLTPTVAAIFTQWMQGVDFGNKAQLHTVLWNSFDFEPTNRKFYKEISSYFVELKQQLLTHCPQLFDDHGAALFVNRLIGRLIFCWFLDKKEIINPAEAYFETRGTDSTVHYRTKLETLFFRVLNTPVEERPVESDTKTPFLNGGLFEAKASDYEGEKCVTFPADYFDRLFTTLRHYNFTTDESSSTYQQVAIDPEMLGRIFENLLAEQREETGEQARKAKGAFYTPREIVDYMCRESLREYLHTAIGDVPGRDEQLSKLIDKKPHEFRDQQRNYRRDLQPFKHDLLRALDSLTILDPACGSGAFPMGMLQLLLETHERLESDFDPYKKKLTIIKNNIFGVDIEPMAVDIARLRAWLSIIVNEDGTTGRIEPLPNLDFKFVCANSLVPLDDTKGLFDKLDDEKLLEVRDEYFRAKKLSRKQELREKYLQLLDGTNKMDGLFASKREQMLKTYRPFVAENIATFFDPRIMFGIEAGFNIIIGNPPYVSHDKISNKETLGKIFTTYEPFADLYCYFLERATGLQSKNGLTCFITSNSYLRAEYGRPLRQMLLRQNFILSVVNIEDFQLFESAVVNTAIILFINKSEDSASRTCLVVNQSYDGDLSFNDFIKKFGFDYSQSDFDSNSWTLISKTEIALRNKIDQAGPTLQQRKTKIRLGLATGANDVFVIDKVKREKFLEEDSRNNEIIKPILRGRDIQRYGYSFSELYILLTKNGVNVEKNYPKIFDYLDSFGNEFKQRGAQGQHWTTLRACAFFEDFKDEKIIWIELSDKGRFALCTEEIYLLNSAYFLIPPKGLSAKYLLGILNSQLIEFYLHLTAETSGMGTTRWINNYVKNFPIPSPEPDVNQKIETLVTEILIKKGQNLEADTRASERAIDLEVFKLYGLTTDEQRFVDNR